MNKYPPLHLRLFVLCLGFLHLGLIAIKALREYPAFNQVSVELPLARELAEFYTQLTVLQADYSFFSPNISPDYHITMTVTDTLGKVTNAFFQFPNTEVEKRFHTCVLATQQLEPDLQEIVAKSWAARVYDRHPQAGLITIAIHQSKLPPMQQYNREKWLQHPPEKLLELIFQTHPLATHTHAAAYE